MSMSAVRRVLLQVEAFQVPNLRRQVEKLRLEAEQVRLGRLVLDDALQEERQRRQAAIAALEEEHRAQLAQREYRAPCNKVKFKMTRSA